jgi:predicted permease
MLDTFEQQFITQRRAHGRWRAWRFVAAASVDAIDAGLGERRRYRADSVGVTNSESRRERRARGSMLGVSSLDVQLGLRMLVRYKGLTLAGGLALAIAIGLGAGWYDAVRDQIHPQLPFPGGDRVVEIEMRNAATSAGEYRILHDFLYWRNEAHAIEELGAYRGLERNLIRRDAPPETVFVAEITASAFRITGVPPLLGRPLVEADEQAGAPPVVVLSHKLWQQRFFARPDIVGERLQIGRVEATVVGVMPEGFGFPRDYRLWIPLQLRPSGYAPLEGPAVQPFGKLAPGATLAQANAEITTLVSRIAAASPDTHQHLRAKVLAFGAEDFRGGSWVTFAVTHLPVLFVLIVACANVGTLVYARTATREAEIAVRHALGASRRRIVGQLFIEALVLAAIAAAIGLGVADVALRWVYAYIERQSGLPFWIRPGLKPATMLYAGLLAVLAAALLGALPALKATASGAPQLKHLGVGGSTLRFGKVWTTAMIAQVALTVICLTPAKGISEEALRDHVIRKRFPAERYLSLEVGIDYDSTGAIESDSEASATRVANLYREFERRVAQEPGVLATTFGDSLPGVIGRVRSADLDVRPGAEPRPVSTLWTASVGPGYFEMFDRPIVAGRGFYGGDADRDARTVLVNEAFARRFANGESPVGRHLRYRSGDPTKQEPWHEIVGVVRDVGMTPTDLGEAPYVYHAASAGTVSPLMMGVRTGNDPAALVPRVRAIAADLDAGIRLEAVRPLDDVVWSVDAPLLAGSAAIVAVVGLGLFLSAAGIFSLVSVMVSRGTREIGIRRALGAGHGRVLANIFSRAVILIGSGILAGNGIIFVFVISDGTIGIPYVLRQLTITSAVMLVVGLLGCIQPARRALRIDPTQALKDA